MMHLILLLLCLPIIGINGFGYMVVDTIQLVTSDFIIAVDALRNAVVPVSVGSSIAVSIAEGFAGAAGGLASRGTANAIGDRKIDSIATKVTSTSAYFLSRRIFFLTGQVFGLPFPLARLVAAVLASIVSEQTKAQGRKGNSINPSSESLDLPEIYGDVTKWLLYDALDDLKLIPPDNEFDRVAPSFTFGAISSVAGSFTRDITRTSGRNKKKISELVTAEQLIIRKPSTASSYAQSALEGAVLFGFYKIVTEMLRILAPESLSMKFIFDQMIETLENDFVQVSDEIEAELLKI